jgi:8-oxo-dGTP diphosphatase
LIVGAAIVLNGRVLACERAEPPEMAGRWEFPGGKVEPGESDVEALVRECVEELGVLVEIEDQVGPEVPVAGGRAVLRVYLARLVGDAQPQALEHSALRWLAADELNDVPWLPADAPIVAALAPLLRGPVSGRERPERSGGSGQAAGFWRYSGRERPERSGGSGQAAGFWRYSR